MWRLREKELIILCYEVEEDESGGGEEEAIWKLSTSSGLEHHRDWYLWSIASFHVFFAAWYSRDWLLQLLYVIDDDEGVKLRKLWKRDDFESLDLMPFLTCPVAVSIISTSLSPAVQLHDIVLRAFDICIILFVRNGALPICGWCKWYTAQGASSARSSNALSDRQHNPLRIWPWAKTSPTIIPVI
mgnify:CR=1 FL=1